MSPPELTLNTQFTIMTLLRDRAIWKDMAYWVRYFLSKNWILIHRIYIKLDTVTYLIIPILL